MLIFAFSANSAVKIAGVVMEFLGLHYAIWIVLVFYFVGMLLMGWWSKRGIASQEGYLLGNRQFGWPMMVMHAFGAGTHPGNVAGVMSQTVVSGAAGIWVSWMWLFGTPFYWIIAPIVRRMRCLTMADFFQQRFGKSAGILYIIVAAVGMVVFLAGVLLATTRTVQGMMGKALTDESEIWFFGILFITTAVFIIYRGGIIAAIRTDMIQGLMIIALSFIAIPAALRLEEVGGLAGMRATLGAQEVNYLRLFDPRGFPLLTVLLLCVNAPLTMLAFPHLMSVCAAGKTEWEGRVGFTYGNVLKRVCTIGWCVLGLCWLVYLINTSSAIHKDAAFGDSIRVLLSPALQGVMLACVMAAAMSSGDAVQVTVAGLFSQNIYRVYFNPKADEKQLVRVTRIIGVVILVKAILDYFNILSVVGISTAMGILWWRMNTTGMFSSTILAGASYILTRHVLAYDRDITIAVPIVVGVLAGVIGSLLTKPPRKILQENLCPYRSGAETRLASR
jgi:Na+/proline symporter